MPTLTDSERDALREQKRAHVEELIDKLLTEEGWASWLRLRRNFHDYSWGNQALIVMGAWAQAHDPSILHPCAEEPTLVKAAWRWKKDGYHPAKGSRGLAIWVFKDRRRKDRSWSCCGQRLTNSKSCPECGRQDHYFIVGSTFDASQVVSFADGTAPKVEVPKGKPIEGDDLAHLIVPLANHAVKEDWCSNVLLGEDPKAGEGGWFRHSDRVVAVCDRKGDRARSGNSQLRTLIHELAHALGVTSKAEDISYAEAEVAVECVSYLVASTVGLDTEGESIPYIAGWGGEGAREKVRQLAHLIDATAKRIEKPLLEMLDAA